MLNNETQLGIHNAYDDLKIAGLKRDAEMKKIPFMLVVGENEMQEESVSVRKHGEGDLGKMASAEFVNYFKDQLTVKI